MAGISDRQLWQMIGNMVSVNILVFRLSKLLPAIGLATLAKGQETIVIAKE